MAAKSKKRLSKIDNKLLKLDKLELKDLICSICQSILVEPVTLPCFHDFCHRCFNGSVENNALCCPLCRLRIGSWLRTATKRKTLVNLELWSFIQNKFPQEIDTKSRGDDIVLPEEKPVTRLSLPGEIRLEYEEEIQRLKAERERLEEKHIEETELLIKKIQQEEEEAHKKYIENLKQDEVLALKIQKEHMDNAASSTNAHTRQNQREAMKFKLKTAKIDGYLSKMKTTIIKEPATTASSSCNNLTPATTSEKKVTSRSPELISSYGKLIKDFIDKKVWNKENGEKHKDKVSEKALGDTVKPKFKNSLLVSLPLPCTGIRQKVNASENHRSKETGSVDSMQQELCYFKPIEGTKPTSGRKGFPLRIPCRRIDKEIAPLKENAPTRAQYLEGLCRLRNVSLSKNLPSAFVITLNLLAVKKGNIVKRETARQETTTRLKEKRTTCRNTTEPVLRRYPSRNKNNIHIDGISKFNNETNLRRTRSMGSINDEETVSTPKKAKINQRKVCSERKPHLRSDSKKINCSNLSSTSPCDSKPINNNKINLVVKNLSSPLQNCDVKHILQEQLRIEEIIEQEKSDFELACKIEAEWNGRRQPRRAAIKRQVSINYALRPAKKLKV
ncbi:E3 ubiquitin-protein ligase RNF168-like [Bombyx mandarina]|uniref:RING-type E3 ubiquitin transferase n=1 Tax=Bombyx mandarina TaxID=7092 RepID=A0A6J2JFB4_BOMMA|nr:E3 ubiquitin-protein ligase RNF168-like [Bombyx mandarina]